VPVEIIESTGYYKVLATGFEDRIEATIMLNKLRKAGYPGAYLRFLKDGVLQ
jgi:MOSC domain-containing protein YiiM